MNVEDNLNVYEDKVSQHATRCCHCALDHKQNELGTGRGSYVVILLVLLLGALAIVKFNDVSVHCCSSSFSFACILLLNIMSVYYCTWTIDINVTILQKYSGTAAHAQAVDTRLSFSSPATWV